MNMSLMLKESNKMGMFDYVHFEMNCPKCGALVKGFQSKDYLCILETIEPDALQNFYASCQECKAWIEFSRYEVAAMGFEMDVTIR